MPPQDCRKLNNFSRPVARIDGGVQDHKKVDLLDPKSELFEPHPLNSPAKKKKKKKQFWPSLWLKVDLLADLFYFILFYFILFYFILFYFILFYFILLQFVSFYLFHFFIIGFPEFFKLFSFIFIQRTIQFRPEKCPWT